MRLLVVLLVGCGASSAPVAETRPPPPTADAAPVVEAPLDATIAIVVDAPPDAAPPPPDAAVATVQCFCFAWVHLDENGDFCYPTRAGCEDRFRTFGRTDKIPCRAERRQSCQRIACRNIGKECFRE